MKASNQVQATSWKRISATYLTRGQSYEENACGNLVGFSDPGDNSGSEYLEPHVLKAY